MAHIDLGRFDGRADSTRERRYTQAMFYATAIGSAGIVAVAVLVLNLF